ncbi:hypothetical protein M0805_004196 [Coniferiporia weirii]|nr:hypothetical protein M0805_004196 [Coniferiporia weirii]
MFFSKLAVSLSLAVPFVSALSITTPTNWTSGGQAVIQWAPVAGDTQSFSIELTNDVFHKTFAIANNIQTGELQLSLELPIVPVGDGYTLEFVNVGNVSDVFAATGDFSIGAVVSSTSSLVSSTSSAASTGSAGSGSSSGATTLTVPGSSQTSSGFGVTVSASSTSGASSISGTTSGTSSSLSGTPSAFNNGAVELGISRAALMGYAVMAGAALAGTRLLGF